MTPCKVKSGSAFNCRFGLFPHDSFIGLPFGSKVYPRGKAHGYLYVLQLTPEYWTAAVTHRTQILYHADCSMIAFGLQLKPGKICVESGTGSGSLTTSLARAIAPHGHIHTFEFNPRRVEAAREDFKNNGLSELVTCYHRDVCAQGFPMVSGGVDAVFLDLPTPWQVVDSSKRLLRPEGRLCSFSPCIEQVQKMCSALAKEGFQDIRTVECLLKTYQVFMHDYPEFVSTPPHRDYYEKDGEQKDEEEKGEEEKGIWEAGEEGEEDGERAGKRSKRDNNSNNNDNSSSGSSGSSSSCSSESNNQKTHNNRQNKKNNNNNKGKRKADENAAPPKTTTKLLCRPFHEMRGHTGYLTFATAPVFDEPDKSAPSVDFAPPANSAASIPLTDVESS